MDRRRVQRQPRPGRLGGDRRARRTAASPSSCPAARGTRRTTAWSTRPRSKACASLPAGSHACIVTDSRLMLDSMTKWIAGWKRRGWKTAGGDPVKNQDLVRALEAEIARHAAVRWHWVNGHETGADHAHKALNDRADRARRRGGLAPRRARPSMGAAMAPLQVEIWSDVVCPWCYIGKRRFEAAVERASTRDVEVTLAQLPARPGGAGRHESTPPTEHLAAKYGMSREQAGASHAQMTELAAQRGARVPLRARARRQQLRRASADPPRRAPTALQDEAMERLMRGYFTEGVAIGDHEALIAPRRGGRARPTRREALESDAYADAVREDEDARAPDRDPGRAVLRARPPLRRVRRAAGRAPRAGAGEGMRLSVLDQSPVPEGSSGPGGTAEHARPRAARGPARLPPLLARRAPRALAGRSEPGGADRPGRRGHRAHPRRQRRRDAAALLAVQGGRELQPARRACTRAGSTSAIGRASGTDPLTTYALQRDRREVAPDDFPQQLAELLAHFDRSLPADHPFRRLGRHAPRRRRASRRSGCSARRPRARSGRRSSALPYAFADFINPRGAEIAASYRERADEPRTAVGVWAICADTDEEAERLASSIAMSMAMLRQNRPIPVPPPEKALRYLEQNPARRRAAPPHRRLARRRCAPGSRPSPPSTRPTR